MNNKKIIITLLIIIIFLSLGVYAHKLLLNKKESVNNPIKKNKYYVVYVKHSDGSASSFVPLKINPDFKSDSDFNVSISCDDDGKVINDGKIIVIDNFVISEENKNMIKKISGEKNYSEALKEIEDRINEIKSDLVKQGRIK